jgi:hypothetical protein
MIDGSDMKEPPNNQMEQTRFLRKTPVTGVCIGGIDVEAWTRDNRAHVDATKDSRADLRT